MPEKRTYADRREENILAVAKRRRRVKTLAIESKYCILVCSNCHREIEAGITSIAHIV